MFTKKDHFLFIAAIFFIGLGYGAMALDPVDNGFGILTLWIAPPLLLLGFTLPVFGILGVNHVRRSALLEQLKLHTHKHVFGFAAFIIAFTTYLVTLEPTASLWDCSEFIASAYKLEVPHTPGTPLSLLVGRFFTMLSFGDPGRVAWCLNMMSAFFSALTVCLVYYIIYYFGEKLSAQNNKLTLVIASFCGSLFLTFSDTFWFSAVEAETYGIACFFLLLLVLLTLKGNDLPEPHRSRWLVLILYVGGLSYCIHPMCLLALPMLPFVWYVKSKTVSLAKVILTISVGLAIVLIINRLVAVGVFELAFYFDLFFVNALSLPFYSGAFFLFITLTILFYWMLKKFQRHAPYTWAVIFLLAGFLPYVILFVRSGHNPPIDEYNPENLSMIKAYMNRESYPSSPLLYGPYYDAQIESVSVKKKHYVKTKDRYEESGTLSEYQYEPSRNTILPRMYSNDDDHVEAYRQWVNLREGERPRFGDNLYFMFSYQLGHMYFRYLLWNYAGRESDHQNSSWLKPWERLHLSAEQKDNKARNQYWMLPLLLGVLGMLFQLKQDRKGFISVMIFFLITGIVLALYLNSPPIEPRERDYIYVGSYIAFAIWIGLGVSALFKLALRSKFLSVVAGVICLGLPLWMAYENFDDHNRAGRTFQVDNARNILSSCQPNSILFTGGDNDTFPLWYLQEVEGFRTDVRVMVLSYFNTDWYINQLRKTYYDSKPFKFTLDEKAYRQYGPNDVLYVQESFKEGIDFRKYLELLKQEHSALRVFTGTGDYYNMLPSKTIKIGVNTSAFVNTSREADSSVGSEMALRVKGNYLQKNALAILDLLISNNWERPLYFNFTSLNTAGLELDNYVVQEGNVYRLTPFQNLKDDILVDTEATFRNLIDKGDYTNLSDPSIYFNYEDYYARMITPVRQSFNTLAGTYLDNGNREMAEKVLLFAVDKLYMKHLEPSYTNLQAADMLSALGRDDLAKSLCSSLFDFHFGKLQAAVRSKEQMNRLDLYLVDQSAETLRRLGDSNYLRRVKGLDVLRR